MLIWKWFWAITSTTSIGWKAHLQEKRTRDLLPFIPTNHLNVVTVCVNILLVVGRVYEKTGSTRAKMNHYMEGLIKKENKRKIRKEKEGK